MIYLYQPANPVAVYNERLAIILGIVTLVLAIATLASCRSCLLWLNRFGFSGFVKSRPYQNFYKIHTYVWWAFSFFIAMHLMVGGMHATYSVVPGDSDAYVHWQIIFSGLGGFVLILIVLSSCRAFAHTLDFLMNRPSLKNSAYLLFYRYHSYYWWIFFLVVIGHFILGYLHAGIWPG
jgi:hypothetical protein